jgi:hypothetical protein
LVLSNSFSFFLCSSEVRFLLLLSYKSCKKSGNFWISALFVCFSEMVIQRKGENSDRLDTRYSVLEPVVEDNRKLMTACTPLYWLPR